MLSEFQTQLVDSIKRCPQDLPESIAHLKPKPKPAHVPKAKVRAWQTLYYLFNVSLNFSDVHFVNC